MHQLKTSLVILTMVALTGMFMMPIASAEPTSESINWMSGNTTLTKLEDHTWIDGDQYLYANIPCTYMNGYIWGTQGNGWNTWHPKVSTKRCVTTGASNYTDSDQLMLFGSSYWQQLDLGAYYHYRTYSNPGTDGLTLITNAYQNYSGATAELYYTDNVLDTFSLFSKDIAGNVVRQQAKPFDHKLTYPDGRAISAGTTSGISYSANGRWMYLDVVNVGQLRIDTHDFSVLSFAAGFQPSYSVYTSISNSGNTIATYSYNRGLRIYDLTNCEVEKPNYAARNCATRNITQTVTDRFKSMLPNPQKLSYFSLRQIKFLSESEIRLFVDYMYEGQSATMFLSLKLDTAQSSNQYLALGDSFSSGEGVYDYRSVTDFYIDDSNYNLCHQSRSSYSYLLSKSLSLEWVGSVACSGAVQKDVILASDNQDQAYILGNPQAVMQNITDYAKQNITSNILPGYIPQSSFIKNYSPSIATITIGGNDIGFGDIVTACVVNKMFRQMQPCHTDRSDREQVANTIDAQIPHLAATFNTIKQDLNGAQRLYVIGYPKLVNYTNQLCSLNTPLDANERQFADSLVEYLNEALRIAANQAGARFIDTSNAFVDADHDYRLCGDSDQKAVNGLTVNSVSTRKPGELVAHESFHPNQLGHSLLAQRIRLLTNDFSLAMPAITATSSPPGAQFRNRLVGDTVITNANKSVNYITDSIPNLITNTAIQVISPVKNVPGSILQNISATVELHSSPVVIGQVTVSTDNTINGNVTIPASVESGYHQLHILYTDSNGQEYDLYRYVMVVASSDDYDGDGTKNTDEACVVDASGVDVDKDGIDDACDGEYVAVAENVLPGPEMPADETTANESPVDTDEPKTDELPVESDKTAIITDEPKVESNSLDATLKVDEVSRGESKLSLSSTQDSAVVVEQPQSIPTTISDSDSSIGIAEILGESQLKIPTVTTDQSSESEDKSFTLWWAILAGVVVVGTVLAIGMRHRRVARTAQ